MPRKAGRLTKQQLAMEVDSQLRDNAKETLANFWKAVNTGLSKGDKHCIELVARAFQYDKGPGGVTIFNQHLQVNGAAAQTEAASRVRSFDQIIGKLEEQENANRANRLMIDAPVGNSEDEDEYDEDITDAEIEDAVPVGEGL